MGKKGHTVGGGMPVAGNKIISGSHGTGKYGEPHKFYDKSMAKYKGPNKELKGNQDQLPIELQEKIKNSDQPGKYGKGVHEMSGESYDMKQAYNKDLTKGARFNYLKNALHNKKGPNKMMKDKQKISKQQDDVLAGVSKYKCGK